MDNTKNKQEKGSNQNAANAKLIGEAFHNPYTFIAFPEDVVRFQPTTLTADELEGEEHRISGILELDIQTLSPLMTCSPEPENPNDTHKIFKALTIGNDVVLPATGVRGALRTLMTIITGGTLGYMDEDLRLIQGRDVKLGPSKKDPKIPDNIFLAEIIKPGSSTQAGVVKLGKSDLIKLDLLKNVFPDLDEMRPTNKDRQKEIYITNLHSPSEDKNKKHWRVKLCGRPIKEIGKSEGVFKADGTEIELSEYFWKDYQGSHRHAGIKELKNGDLIWLEPKDKKCTKITSQADIKSIQWSRWGRYGVALRDIVPEYVMPDSMKDDGQVDLVTDLFGQIPHNDHPKAAGPFAARIRSGNLIFQNAKDKITTETLAPLSAPHPGCLAFYRDESDLDIIHTRSPLKGYKVYRNTLERGDNAPWKYSVQGVYKERGSIKPPQQNVNKTVELLNEGLTGSLRISFRSLAPHELVLLYAACTVDWKLGGGKPLGLGHCRVTGLRMTDEDGNKYEPMEYCDATGNLKIKKSDWKLINFISDRLKQYKATQVPVEKLRYPRAITKNRNKSNRAGYAWFGRHATPKKDEEAKGLQTIWTSGALKSKVNSDQIKAQALPAFNVDNPEADLLYGYDVIAIDVKQNNRNYVTQMEKFDPDKHAAEKEKAGENTSQNRKTRQKARESRE